MAGFLASFLKPRITSGHAKQGPLDRFVMGDVFDPGAEKYVYEPTTTTTPDFLTRVFPQWNFTPLRVYQPEMNLQLLALPPSLPTGFAYGGFQVTGLIPPAEYPSISGDEYS